MNDMRTAENPRSQPDSQVSETAAHQVVDDHHFSGSGSHISQKLNHFLRIEMVRKQRRDHSVEIAGKSVVQRVYLAELNGNSALIRFVAGVLKRSRAQVRSDEF